MWIRLWTLESRQTRGGNMRVVWREVGPEFIIELGCVTKRVMRLPRQDELHELPSVLLAPRRVIGVQADQRRCAVTLDSGWSRLVTRRSQMSLVSRTENEVPYLVRRRSHRTPGCY